MSDSPNEIKQKRALIAVMILHLICSVGFIAVSIYFYQRTHIGDERQQRVEAGEQVILAKIQSETDPEKLKSYALNVVAGSFKFDHALESSFKKMAEGLIALCALPIGTAFMAFWGLRGCRTKE